jgi:hypothetical protein
VPGAVAFLAGFAVTYRISALVTGLVFLLGAINLAGGALSHRLALRVDAHGITLAGKSRTLAPAVPWGEVRSVILHQPRNIPILGIVKSSAGLPVPPLVPGVPDSPPTPDVSMALDSWRLDFARLKQVIGEVAPAVEVVDRR